MTTGVSFDFAKLAASVDKAVTAVEKLDNTLEKTAKTSISINKIFGSNAQLNKFIASLNSIDPKTADNFAGIAKGLTQIFNALAKIPKGDPIRVITRNIGEMIDQLGKLKTSKASLNDISKFVDTFIASMNRLFTGIQALPNIATSVTQITDATNAFVRINSLAARLAKSTTAAPNTKAIVDNVKTFIDGVSAALVNLNSANIDLSNLSRITTALTTVGRALDTFTNVKNRVAGLPAANISSIKGTLASFSLISKELSHISGNTEGLQQLQTLGTSISNVSIGLTRIKIGRAHV